jgi:hypothetical protein
MEHGGERLDAVERVIVTPVAGVFSAIADLPAHVAAGSPIGFVRVGADEVPVLSPFAGELMAVDALDGERLEPYQRVAWLRAA